MLIKNARVFLRKNFVDCDIRFSDVIEEIGTLSGEADLDAGGAYLIPGLVDIHTHGAVGEDFSDGRAQGPRLMADYYAAHGVTSFLATAMTLKEPALTRAMYAVRDYRRARGAKCAGVHLEGPFLSHAKRGAHAAENLRLPDADMLCRLNEASGGMVKLVTVACEEEGGLDFIRKASKICTVSLGHTTANYDMAMKGFEAGATHVTHLYNGMPSFLHRAPGVVGAACDAGASVELICDGLHIHPAVIRATHKLFGDKLNLISDSIRCAGMPDGDYELGGQPVVVKNGKATLPDGTLAGSSVSVYDALKNCVRFGLPLEDVVYAATQAPAEAVGIDAGVIAAGRSADLVLLDPQLNIQAVFVDGVRQ